MKKLKRLAAAIALCACAGFAPVASAQQAATQVQDGIAVKPLSKWRYLQPETVVDQQASQQYAGLLAQARQKGALVPENHPQVQRLRAIATRIIPYATRWNPEAANWKWQVNLLNSSQVNAFCMPGGRIAFFSGILTQLKLSDDEAAAVMGHEIAHALREHGRERAAKSTATGLASRIAGAGLSAWLGIDPRITDTAANTVGQLVVLKFSRDEEREADLIGLDLAARAGFDPRAGIALWRKMGALNKREPVQLLSTHPGGEDRITEIQNHMNVLLPLYARSKGTSPDKLPPYRTAQN
ncbi:MAG: peptidase [Massilia sp.]|nr:peptidase [Massilia sp.]